ncbi:MAG: hypothetical protein CML22_07025 [Rheinheimera sp.]|nr:hypothetical protein [Rheinheimera sp.]MBM34036.1 hypothetical protein [Rheinheimera sp.]
MIEENMTLLRGKSNSFNSGWESYFINRDLSDNPNKPGSEYYIEWADGFSSAQATDADMAIAEVMAMTDDEVSAMLDEAGIDAESIISNCKELVAELGRKHNSTKRCR